VEVQHGAQVRLERDPDQGGVPPTFTMVSSTNMRCTSLGSFGADPRTGPYLCTHLHIETWLLLMMSLRDFEARLGE